MIQLYMVQFTHKSMPHKAISLCYFQFVCFSWAGHSEMHFSQCKNTTVTAFRNVRKTKMMQVTVTKSP